MLCRKECLAMFLPRCLAFMCFFSPGAIYYLTVLSWFSPVLLTKQMLSANLNTQSKIFFVGVGAERGGCLYLYHSRIDRSWFDLKHYLRHCDNCQEKMFFCRKWIFTHYIIEMAFLAMHFLHWHCSPCFPFISDQVVRNLQVSFIFSLQIRFLFSYVLLICKINSLSKSRRWLRYWWKNSFKV